MLFIYRNKEMCVQSEDHFFFGFVEIFFCCDSVGLASVVFCSVTVEQPVQKLNSTLQILAPKTFENLDCFGLYNA